MDENPLVQCILEAFAGAKIIEMTIREPDEVQRRRAAFDNALHSLKMSGRTLDIESTPEFQAVINGTMTFEEATRTLVAKHRKD